MLAPDDAMAMASGDGGTGSPSAVPVADAAVAAVASTAPVASTASVELYGDLHEYGLSLGVDIDAEGEEDLIGLVQEAFNAPLPSSWTEYMDESGRAYYVKEGSSQSTWEHPADSVYRELLELVRQARSVKPPLSEVQRTELVRAHLQQVHEVAKAELAGWSGPYASDQGEYYYNDRLKVSTWECPVSEFESELATRHSVLLKYVLPEASPSTSAQGSGRSGSKTAGATGSQNMLQALRLQLGNLQREPGSGDVPEPSTCRSYHTARSGTSSRSGRSKHSLREHKERRKDRKARRDHGDDSESRGTSSRLDDLPEGFSSPEKASESRVRACQGELAGVEEEATANQFPSVD
eukprot:gb/GFBE01073974.1/.p1 GENE.gb/GFBE01073974.1/~~gb/GFBE01073974.1/.p1  ORF type:complete len:351 (+),score=62.96 gb/GFBE01073974.1/:1-1053(+)